jgi:peptide/nickel transport system substrate-binding protein
LFNTTQPIGSGPFKWQSVAVTGNNVDDRQQQISLLPNDDYYKGRPKLGEFVIRTFLDESHMLSSFNNGELTSIAGVQDLPEEQKNNLGISEYSISVTGAVMVFFNNSDPILNNGQVRKALVSAANQIEVLASLGYPAIIVKSPFLRGMVGYEASVLQRSYNTAEANSLLDAAGWPKGADGIRIKDGKQLSIVLNTLDNIEYATVAGQLQKQWKEVGISVSVNSLEQADLQNAIQNRSYGMLLYGISLGVDPDQFAYWHSSQADILASRRLNFSNYSSKTADASLEAGRTRLDANLRAAKYKPFLDAWREDAPALALYQPRYLYISRGKVFNFDVRTINTPADRFANVHNWMIRTERVTND